MSPGEKPFLRIILRTTCGQICGSRKQSIRSWACSRIGVHRIAQRRPKRRAALARPKTRTRPPTPPVNPLPARNHGADLESGRLSVCGVGIVNGSCYRLAAGADGKGTGAGALVQTKGASANGRFGAEAGLELWFLSGTDCCFHD